mmetsp:Transcript_25066/g.27802  ORF Transcript_25066/g.27802 Transcript_25066/m.27802 type:complete len:129 (+) Transcript_25066:173-559(+)
MRIIYRKEILREFEKQQKAQYLKQYEKEIYADSVKGVFPEMITDHLDLLDVEESDIEQENAVSDDTNSSPTLYKSERFEFSEDEEAVKDVEYEMMIAHHRLKFKLSRQCIKERKIKLRAYLGFGKNNN